VNKRARHARLLAEGTLVASGFVRPFRDYRRILARIRDVSEHLRNSTPNFLQIALLVQNYLYEALGPALGYPVPATAESTVQFVTTNLGTSQIGATLALLTEDQLAAIDRIIAERIDPEVQLASATRQAIEEIRRAPQLSFSLQIEVEKRGRR